MVSISGTRIEIRKFDDKNFVMWKEMMQDVVIIRRQVEAIRHNEKPASMRTKKWKSIDEIGRSIIRMHLAKNVYFSVTKESHNNVHTVGEAPSRLRKAILIIETHIDSKTVQYEDKRHRVDDLPH